MKKIFLCNHRVLAAMLFLPGAIGFFGVTAFAMPAEVLIIRHAEKISDDLPDLSPLGERRAAELPKLFSKSRGARAFSEPSAIFAASPHHEGGSIRSIETVRPLARVLHLRLHVEYNTHEVQDLVSAIINDSEYDGKVVLICWEHKRIPEIARLFGVSEDPQWPHHAYDRVWRLDFAGNRVTFADLPEELLPGDSGR